MATDQGWATVAARLASFDIAVPIPTKKRASNAKGSKTISWPHQSPSPAMLAGAGFYYRPSATSRDNTQCFLCERALDGWEEEDDPLTEHLKHSPDCGWAIIASLSQDGLDFATLEDPTGAKIVEARKATFALMWPHDGKRGWTCKTEKMVQAGWHYAPIPESDDFVSCAYCKLALDGWEPKDNPFDEHYKRSPDCPFFTFAGTQAPKAVRGKKSRASKASRLSTQSNLTVASEAPSIPDLDESIDVSTLSVSTIASTTSTMGNKKNTRGKGKSSRSKKAESIEIAEDLQSMSADGAPPVLIETTRGRKRSSDDISGDDRGHRESTVRPEPPTKKRNTRTRGSAAQEEEVLPLKIDSEATDVDMVEETRKPAKGGRKRASSRARKASYDLVASTASLRAGLPDNATIEAALEADLERPMSDEERPPADGKQSKARTKKTAAASKASMRDTVEAAEEDGNVNVETEDAQEEGELPASAAANTQRDGESPASKRSKSTKSKAAKRTTTKRAARSKRGSAASNVTDATNADTQLESSMLTARTLEDDSGHETDASVGGKSIARKGSKRKATSKGRPKKAKNIEDVVQSQPSVPAERFTGDVADPPSAGDVASHDAEAIDPNQGFASAESLGIQEPASKPVRKATTASKANAAKAKKCKEEKPPQLSMPGAFSPLMPEQTPEPSFASVLSPTSPPIAKNTETTPRFSRLPIPAVEKQLTPSKAPSSAQPTPTPRQNPKKPAQREPTPSPSPQSSDAENVPPSSRPASVRPPLAPLSPTKNQILRVPLALGTPKTVPLSPSKIGGGLRSEIPWSNVDVEMVFAPTPGGGEGE